MIRVGLVGYGLAGSVFHAPYLRADPAFGLVAVATRDADRRARAAAENPGAAVVGLLDDVLAAGVDLVVLGSPPHVHEAQAVRALEAGCAVVIDKPFAPSTAAADAVIAASERAGRPVFVFHNRRWDGDFLTIRRLLDAGEFGEVIRFESSFERWGAPKAGRWQSAIPVGEGGGILFDLGSHLIDQALQLFGPAEVTAAETRTVHPGAAGEDDAFVSLLHGGGVRSHLAMSRVARASGPRFRVLGTRAAYTVSGLDPQEDAVRRRGAAPSDPGFGTVDEAEWGVLSTDEATHPVATDTGRYADFYRGVAGALAGTAPTPVDVQDARAVVEIIERAHDLAR